MSSPGTSARPLPDITSSALPKAFSCRFLVQKAVPNVPKRGQIGPKKVPKAPKTNQGTLGQLICTENPGFRPFSLLKSTARERRRPRQGRRRGRRTPKRAPKRPRNVPRPQALFLRCLEPPAPFGARGLAPSHPLAYPLASAFLFRPSKTYTKNGLKWG